MSDRRPSPLQRAVRRARRGAVLRRVGVPVYVRYRRLTAPRDGQPILVNSIPKAGTHLVSSMLDRLPGISFSGMLLQQDLHAADLSHPEGDPVPYDEEALRA